MAWKQITLHGVRFEYPDPTPQGNAVERNDDDRGDMQRIHLSSPDSAELYFEASRFVGLAPQDEYARHRPYLEQRFGGGAVTELEEAKLGDRSARRYGIRWADGERAVRAVDVAGDTYRFIYDPRSQLNEQILSTVRFVDSVRMAEPTAARPKLTPTQSHPDEPSK
jgi:hypothetical protein